MRKIVKTTILFFSLGLLQASFFYELFGSSLTPNLIMAYVFATFFLDREEDALMQAYIGGLILDFFGMGTVGLSSFVMVIIILVSTFIRRYLFRGRIFNLFAIVSASIVYSAVVYKGGFFDMTLIINPLASILFYMILSGRKDEY